MSEEPDEKKDGIYHLMLYGIGGGLVYECYFPVRHTLSYTVPVHYGGIPVTQVVVEWQER